MVDRYLGIVLARPDDETAMQRLLEHASRLPEGVQGLERMLEARRTEPNMRLVIAALAHGRADDVRARQAIQEATLETPNRPEAYRLLARIERSVGNLDGALAALTSASTYAPSDAAMMRERAALLLDLGRIEEARAVYAQLPSTSAWERTEFVRTLASRGLCAEALPSFDAAEQTSSDPATQTTLLLLRAHCEDEVNDASAAQASLTRALNPARRAGRDLEVLDALLDLARKRGTLEALLPQLELMGANARPSLGMVLEELGRDEGARRVYTQHLRSHARDADVHVRLAHLLARSGELDAALAERRALARLFPDRLAFTLELADALASLGRTEEALRVLDAARARGRRDAGVLRRVLDAYSRIGDRDRILRTLEDLVASDPTDASRVTALASEWIARGEPARAQALIDSLARGDSAEGALAAGRAAIDARLFEVARTHLERANALAPGQPAVLDATADLYERTGRTAEAQRVIETRLQPLDAQDPASHDLEARLIASWARGGILAQQREPLRARAEQGDVRALRMAAEVDRRLGDIDAALASLTRLEALTPDDVHVVSALQRLHHARHDYEAEVRTLRRLVALEPARAGWHLSQLVELALSVYRDEDALAFANEAGGRAFNDANLAIRLGRLEARRHDQARASALYRRALEVDPDAHEAAWELASIERDQGHDEAAALLYASITLRTNDDELRDRAAQAALESARVSDTLSSLEPRFLALALAHGDSPAHRRPALILYTALLHAHEQNDPGAVERTATRALPVLLAGVRDADASHRAMSQDILLRYPVRGSAAPLLALGLSEHAELSLRRAATFAALRVIDASNESALRTLLASLDARLRIAALHGLARVLSPNTLRTLLTGLRIHADLELRVHAAWWSTITAEPGRPLPREPHLVDDAALPAPARLRVLALTETPNAASLDWLAEHALSQTTAVSRRHPFFATTQLTLTCVPHLEPIETLDAWVAHAEAICPTHPRDDAALADALERAVHNLPAPSLPTALARLADLAVTRPSVVLLATRTLHARLGNALSLRDARNNLRLTAVAPSACDAACWDRYRAHPSAEVRAAAIEIEPRDRVLAYSGDASWLVRRARILRLAQAPLDAASFLALREALSDPSLYVRTAAVENLGTHLDVASCGALQARAQVEESPALREELGRLLGLCNTQQR